MNLNNLSNEYLPMVSEMFEKTPKSVWAALAISFAIQLCEDDLTKTQRKLRREWEILYLQGIIPQNPDKYLGKNHES